MFKFVALYKTPSDTAAFDQWMAGQHLPICAKVPNLSRTEVTRFTGSPSGTSDLYMMVEMYFETKDGFKAALNSPEMMEAGKDAHKNAKEVFSGYFGKVETPALV